MVSLSVFVDELKMKLICHEAKDGIRTSSIRWKNITLNVRFFRKNWVRKKQITGMGLKTPTMILDTNIHQAIYRIPIARNVRMYNNLCPRAGMRNGESV